MFYDELFRRAPETRALFPQDMRQQHAKFIQMLAAVINNIDDLSAVATHIADLGRRHEGYEVKPRHYAIVGTALLAMLRRLLGPKYTPEVGEAWAAAYDTLARAMQQHAGMVYPPGTFFDRTLQSALNATYGVSEGVPTTEEQEGSAKPADRPSITRSG